MEEINQGKDQQYKIIGYMIYYAHACVFSPKLTKPRKLILKPLKTQNK